MSEKQNWKFDFQEFSSEQDFSAEDQNLIKAAKEAALLSYSPYSKFRVGAALLRDDNEIIKGANQENASFPEGSCAERVAFVKAATHETRANILKVAVIAMKNGELHPATPCGGCRQVMLEYEVNQASPIELIMKVSEGRWIKVKRISMLLPFSFEF